MTHPVQIEKESSSSFLKFASFQNRFHVNINTFINGGLFHRYERLLSLLSPKLPISLNAKEVTDEFRQYQQLSRPTPVESFEIKTTPYEGKLKVIEEVQHLIAPLRFVLDDVFVHGSVASDEVCDYSDLDTLIVLKPSFFASEKAAIRCADTLNSIRSLFYRFDPLQHHGWFVLTTEEYSAYCDAYFPSAALSEMRSLLHPNARIRKIHLRNSETELIEVFLRLSNGVLNTAKSKKIPPNLYAMKSLLSRVFLLPALYVQAKTRKSITKKESFHVAANDFSREDWEVMNQLSQIRSDWSKTWKGLDSQLRKSIRFQNLRVHRYSGSIPKTIKRAFYPTLYDDLTRLIRLMQKNVDLSRSSNGS